MNTYIIMPHYPQANDAQQRLQRYGNDMGRAFRQRGLNLIDAIERAALTEGANDLRREKTWLIVDERHVHQFTTTIPQVNVEETT